MRESQPGLLPTGKETSRRALDFLHGQLLTSEGESGGLDDLLNGLASAFQAIGAGLATVEAAGPVLECRVQCEPSVLSLPLPWQVDTSWLEQLNPARGAMRLKLPAQVSFLVAASGGPGTAPGLIWLEDDEGREWSAAEGAALSLTASLLACRSKPGKHASRWVGQLDRQARQRQMELATHVTRRLAHDFGNVMTGILGFTELALAQPLTADTPLHTYLTEAHKAAQNGALFTHQLRLLSRRQAVSNHLTNLPNLLAEEEKRYRTLWGPNPVIITQTAAELPRLMIGADPLRQALYCLMENAREAMFGRNAGAITVSATVVNVAAAACRDWYGEVRPGPHVEICVRDNGAGLELEVARHLFAEPFFSTKTRKRGFGLALAFGIVSGHRGGLDLQGGADGGATARLLIPVAEQHDAKIRPRVLVVDDDPLILQFVCTTLERAGYQVQQASCAADAFRFYTAAAADLVLSDVAMPQENGIELARRLLSCDANLRLLFMSGKVLSDVADPECIARQFQILSKPFRPDGLLKAVRDALDRPVRSRPERLSAPTRA